MFVAELEPNDAGSDFLTHARGDDIEFPLLVRTGPSPNAELVVGSFREACQATAIGPNTSFEDFLGQTDRCGGRGGVCAIGSLRQLLGTEQPQLSLEAALGLEVVLACLSESTR